MHFYLAKITLHHHALGMRSQPVPWHHVPPDDEFDEESACIKAAVDAIEYTSSHLEQEEARTIPWHSAYVMFISTVTLLTAASFLDHSDRLSFQGTINTATLVLSNTTYGSWHAKSCYIQFTQVSSALPFLCHDLVLSRKARLPILHFLDRSLTCLTDTVQHNQ